VITPYFKPWYGKKFRATKLLILGESAYDWPEEDGKRRTPQPTHPRTSLLWSIKKFGEVQYFTRMNRALCASESPTVERMTKAWNEYAYAIYVQGTVGLGARRRPTQQQFRDAGLHFLRLIEKLQPSKVIVTGIVLWNAMPSTTIRSGESLKAYMLSDGALVWCLAIPHPANRQVGFNWKRVSKRIRWFRSAKLPIRN
jgi:hypothetical protein